MRRLVGALAAFVGATVLTPAVAHADAAGPTDYRSEVVAVTPASDAVAVTTEGGDAFLRIEVAAGHVVDVLGYDGEPYLRVDDDGTVYRNLRSYATYYNEDRLGDVVIPETVDNSAAPEWDRVGDGGAWAWHDHRTHWMADEPPIGLEPGDAIPTSPVPIVVDGTPTEITVRTVLLADPSVWPSVFGIVFGLGIGFLAMSLGPASGTLAGLVLAASALVVGGAQFRSLPAETGPRLTWWVLPALAVVCLVAVVVTYGRSTWLRLGLQALAALELVVWAVGRRAVLTSAVLPTDLPFGVDRFVTAAVLAGSVVMLVGLGRDLFRLPAAA